MSDTNGTAPKIDGNWYQVDVTWNDSQDDFSNYYYFNLTDEQMIFLAQGR